MLRAALALVLVGGVAADDDALEVPPQGAPVPILYGESYSYSYEATPAPTLYSFSYAEDEYGPTAFPTLVGGGLPFLIPGAPTAAPSSAAPSYTFAPTLTGYPTASPTTPPSASPSSTFAPTLTGYPTASPTTPKPTVTGYPTLTGYPTGAPTSTSPPSDKTAPCTLCGACYNENGPPNPDERITCYAQWADADGTCSVFYASYDCPDDLGNIDCEEQSRTGRDCMALFDTCCDGEGGGAPEAAEGGPSSKPTSYAPTASPTAEPSAGNEGGVVPVAPGAPTFAPTFAPSHNHTGGGSKKSGDDEVDPNIVYALYGIGGFLIVVLVCCSAFFCGCCSKRQGRGARADGGYGSRSGSFPPRTREPLPLWEQDQDDGFGDRDAAAWSNESSNEPAHKESEMVSFSRGDATLL